MKKIITIPVKNMGKETEYKYVLGIKLGNKYKRLSRPLIGKSFQIIGSKLLIKNNESKIEIGI